MYSIFPELSFPPLEGSVYFSGIYSFCRSSNVPSDILRAVKDFLLTHSLPHLFGSAPCVISSSALTPEYNRH